MQYLGSRNFFRFVAQRTFLHLLLIAFVEVSYSQIPKHSPALQRLQNFITIVYWPQPLKIYNHAYQFKWRRLESGRGRWGWKGKWIRCLWYYIILGSVYTDAMHNKSTYKNSSWIGVRTSLSPLSLYFIHSHCLYTPYILTAAYFIYPFSDFCMHEWWKDEGKECENLSIFTFLPSIFCIPPSCQSRFPVKHNTSISNLRYLIGDEILEKPLL